MAGITSTFVTRLCDQPPFPGNLLYRASTARVVTTAFCFCVIVITLVYRLHHIRFGGMGTYSRTIILWSSVWIVMHARSASCAFFRPKSRRRSTL